MVKRMMVMAMMLWIAATGITRAEEKALVKEAETKHIDMVFAIDVSGSMQGIITAAQKKVWAIVNEIATAKPAPIIRIGLIAYRGEQEECYGGKGFRVWDLSDDLDKVYQQLMALTTGGGERECVGRAIYEATNSMSWDKSGGGYKVLFVLGNEGANQDSNQDAYGYKNVASAAVKQDININTVYCQGGGPVSAEWPEIAALADGVFTTIGLEGKVVEIATPMDKELAELNSRLNRTYLAYGQQGNDQKELQAKMDAAAQSVAGSKAPAATMAERAVTKAGNNYRNDIWDLVDASKNKDFKLDKIKDEELPAEMRKMSQKERETYLQQKSKEREEIQKQILELGQKRAEYVNEEMKKQQLKGDEFDQVITNTLQKQAEKKGFIFK